MAKVVDLSGLRTQSSDGASIASSNSKTKKRKSGSHKHHHHKHHLESPLPSIRALLRSVKCTSHLDDEGTARLAKHLVAVALGVRIAHWLMDCFELDAADLQEMSVRFAECSTLRTVALLYEPLTKRTFVINTQLERDKLDMHRDEALSNFNRWFIQYSVEKEEPYIIPHESLSFFAAAINGLSDQMKDIPVPIPKGRPLPVLGLPSLQHLTLVQAASQLLTIQQWVGGFPACYVIDPAVAARDAVTIFDKIGQSKAFLVSVFLEGLRPEDDHLLLKSTFPASLFASDGVFDTDRIESDLPNLKDMTDRYHTFLYQVFDDNAMAKHIWSDITITVDGPLEHTKAWQSCAVNNKMRNDLTHYLETELMEDAMDHINISEKSDGHTQVTAVHTI